MSSPIDDLAHLLKELPGVGERQSRRFAYFFLHRGDGYRSRIAELIKSLGETITQCRVCYIYFTQAGKDICPLCEKSTNSGTIFIVEKDTDRERIARAKVFDGQYFVLGGVLPLVHDGDVQDIIRTKELVALIEERGAKGILQEIIIGLSATPDGDRTTEYLHTALLPYLEKYSLRFTRLGRGLSTGTEIEYSDDDTIRDALLGRK